jgi:hypothetical protein
MVYSGYVTTMSRICGGYVSSMSRLFQTLSCGEANSGMLFNNVRARGIFHLHDIVAIAPVSRRDHAVTSSRRHCDSDYYLYLNKK